MIGDRVVIEVKASSVISERMTKGLKALAEEVPLKRKIIVCNERHPKMFDNGIEVLPVQDFLRQLWEDKIC